ncbi:hypothetical protein ABL78_1895 [Leptomonas seymouri]|uniref:RNA-editing substrate-binding complex 6 protein domain-containing protein n=1 Tax=Leptomonas seymouri TaxID=5684 RepID=A0A0N1ILX8_LEPSE|nr:hypothetical protein ABL78_1895 [Leptomonas seymouri]|eukprot:KPI89011.1 hypothetical protein ABL78_1895 [Leptomonas seymouri]
MWTNAALRYTSRRSRHAAVAAALSITTVRRHLLINDGGASSSAVSNAKAWPDAPSPCFSSTAAPAAQKAQKESRFVRASAPRFPDAQAADGIGNSSDSAKHAAATNPTTTEALVTQVLYPHGTRSQRMLSMYLRRVQTVLCHKCLPSVEARARCELNKILLPAIKTLDAPTVTVLLETLRMADVEETAPIVQDAVAWLSLNGYHLPLQYFIQVVELLHHFNAPLTIDFIRSLPQRLPQRDVTSLTVTQAAALLTALLPILRYTTAEETEGSMNVVGAVAGAKAVPIDVALVEVAELLRERCSGEELAACNVASLSELLRVLLAFTSSREWRFVNSKETWTALVEAMCLILVAPPELEKMELSAAVQLLTALSHRAHGDQSDHSSLEVAAVVTQAEKRLSSALAERVKTAADALQNVPQPTSAISSGAPKYAVWELPHPWKIRDVRALWKTCLKSSCAVALARELDDSGVANIESEYQKLMEYLQTSLLVTVSRRFASHYNDIGAAEMAFSMASGIAEVERAAAQRARDSQPVTGEPPSTSVSAAATPVWSNLSGALSSAFLEALLLSSFDQLHAKRITWTPATVQDAVALFEYSSDNAHRTRALELAQAWYTQLQARAQDGERLLPQELLGFFTPELLRQERLGVDAAVDASLRRWSVSEVLFFFSRLGTVEGFAGGVEGAAVLRQAGSALCAYAAKASAGQLASLVECYGAARVRNDDFCEAAIKRLSELLDASLITASRSVDFSSAAGVATGAAGTARTVATATTTASSRYAVEREGQAENSDTMETSNSSDLAKTTSPVTIHQLTRLLRSFALMEVRQTKPFVDAAPHVTLAASEDEGSAEEVTQLLAAYAKMLIWNYPVFRALAERLCRLRKDDVQLDQLLTAQLALLRMDVTLPLVTTRFYEALTEHYSTAKSSKGTATRAALMRGTHEPVKSRRARLKDAVMQLSVLSRVRTRSHVNPPDPSVRASMIEFIVKQADMLRVEELAEVLLSLARFEEGRSSAFEELTVRTLGLLPTAPPRVMAHIAEAYALADRSDAAELFTLIAERTVAMRHDMAAITIASILASFAKAGVRNDRLFIEVIPRVRHVATYGTPRDVVNVVSAYAAVSLWHYKLFARLADRAIQLRADFRVHEVVKLLKAYAAVQMRYDVLFTEFAPRIQTLAHLLTPSDLAAITSSYSQLNIPCVPVWKATASRAIAVADAFTEEEARQLLDSYSMQSFYNEACVKALTTRFPVLLSIPFDNAETKESEPSV